MKRILLLGLALSIGALAYAQVGPFKAESMDLSKKVVAEQVATKSSPITQNSETPESSTYNVADREITFIPIGKAGNAYGFYGNPRTYLWADDNIKSVVMTHRMVVDPPGSYGNSRIAYDVSWDAGVDGSWTNSIQVYEPLGPGSTYPDAAGRYPQGGIYNPYGNTDPANAYYAYFAATLDNTNGNWGGYGYGTNHMISVDPPAPTQYNSTSSGDMLKLIPDSYTINQMTGDSWMIDGSFLADDYPYQGNVIMNQGIFDEELGDYEYEETTMDLLEADYGWNDSKIAFAPDGQIGYFLVMGDGPDNPDWTNYHPILFITEDGGETWSDEPIHCQLGGEDGIENVKNFVSDEVMEAIYGAGYNRDEIYYNMGFQADMVVDENGNAHLTGLIACADEEGWYPNYEASGTFHVMYDYEEEEWSANLLYMNKTFDGDLGGIPQYNRPQVSTDMDGHFMFFSWIDTDLEGVTDNTSPDIYCIAYDPHFNGGEGQYSEVVNVTAFTQAMWQAYMGSQSHYVFSSGYGDETITFTVPFVYQELDPEDPAAEVQFWYLDGVTFEVENYWLGVEDLETNAITSVDQNYPNPFSNNTTINVNLSEQADLSLEVTNLVGQKVFEINKGVVNAGSYDFVLNADNFTNGVYFYTVRANNNQVTKKMIVE